MKRTVVPSPVLHTPPMTRVEMEIRAMLRAANSVHMTSPVKVDYLRGRLTRLLAVVRRSKKHLGARVRARCREGGEE